MKGAVAVRAIGASKTYQDGFSAPVTALDGVSLEVAPGELVAVNGPSGCGKSTLLNLAGCIDLPSSGIVEIEGRATTALSDDELTALRRERVGIVSQFFNLLPSMTVSENVGLPLMLQRRPRAEIWERVRCTLARVNLSEKADAFAAQLSGGQMQRAAIARAIVHEPAILIADEPTGNLDSYNGAAILALLRELSDGGQAILLATHAEGAAQVSDRVLRMVDGHLEAVA